MLKSKNMYLVWNHERQKWWARSHHGYTDDKSQAGRYTIAQANHLCVRANQVAGDRPEETMVEEY